MWPVLTLCLTFVCADIELKCKLNSLPSVKYKKKKFTFGLCLQTDSGNIRIITMSPLRPGIPLSPGSPGIPLFKHTHTHTNNKGIKYFLFTLSGLYTHNVRCVKTVLTGGPGFPISPIGPGGPCSLYNNKIRKE